MSGYWFQAAPNLRFMVDYNEDQAAITAALCKVIAHPTLLGDVFAEAIARVFVQDGRTDLCRAHLDMLFDYADDRPVLEPSGIRWFKSIREQGREASDV